MEKEELYAGIEERKKNMDKREEIDEEGVKKGKRRRTRREGGERGRRKKKGYVERKYIKNIIM
jgi:hypothetical protein